MALAPLISPDLTVRTVASSVVYTLVIPMCGTKTGMIGIGRLYAVHDHIWVEMLNEEFLQRSFRVRRRADLDNDRRVLTLTISGRPASGRKQNWNGLE